MRKKLILISIVLFLFGFLIASNIIQSSRATTKAVVVVREIKPYTVISADALAVQDVPKSIVSSDTIMNVEDAVGKTSLGVLLPGEILRQGHVIDARYSRLSGSLSNGKVAIALPSNLETTVAGTIKTGDHVDVYAAYKDYSELVLENATVKEKMAGQSSGPSGVNDSQDGIVLEINKEFLETYLSAVSKNAKFLVVLKPIEVGE